MVIIMKDWQTNLMAVWCVRILAARIKCAAIDLPQTTVALLQIHTFMKEDRLYDEMQHTYIPDD